MLQCYSSSILAVGYEARKFGISRMIRGDEAKEKYPDLILFHVPEKRGKADLTKYRLAGAEVGSLVYGACMHAPMHTHTLTHLFISQCHCSSVIRGPKKGPVMSCFSEQNVRSLWQWNC